MLKHIAFFFYIRDLKYVKNAGTYKSFLSRVERLAARGLHSRKRGRTGAVVSKVLAVPLLILI
jgi:hypothetical protein